MNLTQLNRQQLAAFDTFGYLNFPGLLSGCVDKIIEEFEGDLESSQRRARRQTS